jgi:hypothetical protein
MIRDYSKNALAVREQREEDVYHYLKGEGLEARFWCDFHRDFYQTVILNPKLVAKNMVPIVKMRLSVFWTGNLPRAVPKVDECGLAEIGNSKEETRGTQFRQVRAARYIIPYVLYAV